MKAVGRLIGKNKMGYEQVELYVNGCWESARCIYNPTECLGYEAGLFEFYADDQFCKWIDPNKA